MIFPLNVFRQITVVFELLHWFVFSRSAASTLCNLKPVLKGKENHQYPLEEHQQAKDTNALFR